MSVAVKVNKSAVARQILSDIGALSKNPPEGWRATAEAELAKQNITMHKVSLYQLRSKSMNGKVKPAKAKTKARSNDNSIAIEDLQSVRNLLSRIDADSLNQIIDALK